MKLTSILEASKMLDTKDRINAWLKNRGKRLEAYTINDDLTVSAEGTVFLSDLTLHKLPVKFKETGSFKIINARLTTLEGCPDIVNGLFDCSDNPIKDLVGGPKIVKTSYVLDNTQVTSLKGVADEVDTGVSIKECNGLTRLDYLPKSVDMLTVANGGLTSLQGIHKIAKNLRHLDISGSPITSHILGLLRIPSLKYIWCNAYKGDDTHNTPEQRAAQALRIVAKYINDESRDVMACQDELIDLGLDDFAQL